MDEREKKEIKEAVDAADVALLHLRSARESLGSAGRWGLYDIFTQGGWIAGILKHRKMSDAETEMELAKYALNHFCKELRDVKGFEPVHVGEFLKFADIFFDGILVDLVAQSKINEAKEQCDSAINQVVYIRKKLMNRYYES